jgi:hypothetical protein
MNTDTLVVLHAALAALSWAKDGYIIYSKIFDQAIEDVQNQIIILETEDDPDSYMPD